MENNFPCTCGHLYYSHIWPITDSGAVFNYCRECYKVNTAANNTHILMSLHEFEPDNLRYLEEKINDKN